MLIHDSTPADLLFPADKGRGLVPRDWSEHPAGFLSPPSEMPLIPRSEWSARIKELETTKSRLSDVRGPIPSLDQGQVGYCWAHSTTHAVMLCRAVANDPYIPLSAYAVAATIKRGADEGGWCGLSAKFHREKGAPSQAIWPQGDRDYRKYDKPETWANADAHRTTEEWVDLAKAEYDQTLTFDQVATCLLSRIPCAVDFNWWSHSVCALDLVEVEAGSFGLRIWNSWADSWGERGTGVLQGQKAIPDGAVALRTARAGAV
jgi:C1A family cysteine protease